ncbi:MAG: NAD-dependent deacylase [Acidobacteria bacterium]|nr:NAD-dependent deacylase [Acidobacteriota bacterium]
MIDLREAQSIAVLTGAGISAESGIPTFRGPGGLWRNFRPEELATPEAFARDPQLVWEWYLWRRRLIAAAEPNAGHRALVELERRTPRFTLITQNVDGLHDLAGSQRILKIHGDIWHSRCSACSYQRRDRSTEEMPPPCPECGAMLRPGVVWFGESLPRIVWDEAERAVSQADVLLVAGTSATVYPAAGLLHLARYVIEVNQEETPFSDRVAVSLRGSCGEVLPRL